MAPFHFPPVSWRYDDPTDWCCETSQFQSPININTSQVLPMEDAGDIYLDYSQTVEAFIDTGYCLQGFTTGSATINQRQFRLEQFHFHAHGEHTINQTSFPLELHFVHRSQNDRLAVLAVFFEIGKENQTLNHLFDMLVNDTNHMPINLYSLLPKSFDYYHYLGSLTTPPLTENVEWYVLEEPVTLSQIQFERLTAYHAKNTRKTQPLNGRTILKKTYPTSHLPKA